ncbi:MAG: HypC/HybG/HupF family hydrogenase formation chaperone [Acetobacteraceae bacterium]
MCLAVPGQVLSVDGDDPLTRTGRVSFGGTVKQVNLAYVPEVHIGDFVLVHAGFAISIVNEQEAQRTIDYLMEIAQEESREVR